MIKKNKIFVYLASTVVIVFKIEASFPEQPKILTSEKRHWALYLCLSDQLLARQRLNEDFVAFIEISKTFKERSQNKTELKSYFEILYNDLMILNKITEKVSAATKLNLAFMQSQPFSAQRNEFIAQCGKIDSLYDQHVPQMQTINFKFNQMKGFIFFDKFDLSSLILSFAQEIFNDVQRFDALLNVEFLENSKILETCRQVYQQQYIDLLVPKKSVPIWRPLPLSVAVAASGVDAKKKKLKRKTSESVNVQHSKRLRNDEVVVESGAQQPLLGDAFSFDIEQIENPLALSSDTSLEFSYGLSPLFLPHLVALD